MSFNFSSGKEFVSGLEQALDTQIPKKYKRVLKLFWESWHTIGSWYAIESIVSEKMSRWNITLKDINNQIVNSWYQIYLDAREGIYYLDFIASKKTIAPRIQWQIEAYKDLVRYAGIVWVDFDAFTINGKRYTDYEFVQQIHETVWSLTSKGTKQVDHSRWETETPKQESTEQEEQKLIELQENIYNIPEWFDSLRPGSEKLWKLYEANIGTPLPTSDITSLTGLPLERIWWTHGNLKTRFSLAEGYDIKSLGRIKPWFVYCKVSDFEGIKEEYLAESPSDVVPPHQQEGVQETLQRIKLRRTELKAVENEKTNRKNHSHLFREGTAPYELYNYFLTSQWETSLLNAKKSGIHMANGGVTLKSINAKLLENGTGQYIKSIEWKRWKYEFTDGWQGQDIEIKEDLQGETFRISAGRMSSIASPNRKIFNPKKITVKWIELTADEFIFCLLCWEDQEVWIDKEELEKNFVDWVSKTWGDIIRFKLEIERKLWNAKLEFLVPEKESILLREKKQAEYSKKFLQYMQENPGKIIQKAALMLYLKGIGTEEKFKLAFNKARELNKWNTSIIHKVWWGWDAFYYGDFEELQKLRQQADTNSSVQPIKQSEKVVEETPKNQIKVKVSDSELSTIIEDNPELNIDYVSWIVAEVELIDAEFNVFLVCLLHKWEKISPSFIFEKLTGKASNPKNDERVLAVRSQINQKFWASKSHLMLKQESGSDNIWFWDIQQPIPEEHESEQDTGVVETPPEGNDIPESDTTEETATEKDVPQGDTTNVEEPTIQESQPEECSTDVEEVTPKNDVVPEEESTTKIIRKEAMIFQWDTESWLVEYEGGLFDLNEIGEELPKYITRLLKSDKEEVKIKMKWSRNPENEKHRISKELTNYGLPFSCWNVNQKLIPFSVKVAN